MTSGRYVRCTMTKSLGRRDFLKASAAALAASQFAPSASAQEHPQGENPHGTPAARADSVILIWLPGGVSQVEYWDPKPFTPWESSGMKGSDFLSPCRSIPTPVDDMFIGQSLENIASVMDKGTILRTLTNTHDFGFDHPRAMYHVITGYAFPAGFNPPSIGAKISRFLGRRHPDMPPFIDIGREILDVGAGGPEMRKFINGLHGPGFYGIEHAPFLVKEPEKGIATLNAVAGMKVDRLDRRQDYLREISGLSSTELRESGRVTEYMSTVESARTMMDSSVKDAFRFKEQESPEVLAQYDVGHRFGWSCLLARRLVERGARFIEVEYPFKTFGFFDTHVNGWKMNDDIKRHIDRPIAQLVRDLDERGLLDRTLVVIMSEFGRTIASLKKDDDTFKDISFATGDDGAVGGIIKKYGDGSNVFFGRKNMYGMHGHFPRCSSVVFFGGGMKRGFVYGKSADRHPMVPVENPVTITDLHATILHAMGIAPDVYYTTERRPVFLTDLGRGKPVYDLFA